MVGKRKPGSNGAHGKAVQRRVESAVGAGWVLPDMGLCARGVAATFPTGLKEAAQRLMVKLVGMGRRYGKLRCTAEIGICGASLVGMGRGG